MICASPAVSLPNEDANEPTSRSMVSEYDSHLISMTLCSQNENLEYQPALSGALAVALARNGTCLEL